VPLCGIILASRRLQAQEYGVRRSGRYDLTVAHNLGVGECRPQQVQPPAHPASSRWNPASRSSAFLAPAGATASNAASSAARAVNPPGVIPTAAAPTRIWSRSSVDSLTCIT
jgi:hypothetical protein